ncbi:BnaAnng31890D [Brassica napus]|uniref:(rape) hypothetical protein n=1 Tax=Brassica napus TaxID=3708 RepID=A0A078JSS9_BRANA|nr:unnamed protein product [Brassica napus]CDY69879.1 BnaAnng31890D [Brassica napus]
MFCVLYGTTLRDLCSSYLGKQIVTSVKHLQHHPSSSSTYPLSQTSYIPRVQHSLKAEVKISFIAAVLPSIYADETENSSTPMALMIAGYLSDNGIGRCPHKGVKATNVVSSGASIGIYRLLSSWMVDQTTLGRAVGDEQKKTLVIVNKLVEDSRRDIEKAVENEEESVSHYEISRLVATSRQLEGKVEVQKLMEENVNNAKSWL